VPERVLLQPAPLEYGLHREQYDTLVEALEAQGVLVRVLARTERRSDLPGSGAPPAVLYDLVIHVGEIAGVILGTAKLMEMVRRGLRGREGRRGELRRAKLYLANGEEHEFALDAEVE
jgi:hypothetical protein